MIKGGEHDLCCLRRCIVSVSLSCECDAALHDTDDTWAVHKNPPHMYVDDFYGSFIDRYFFDNDIFMYSLLCIICHKLLFYDIFSYKTRAISDSNVENDTGRACWLYMVGWNAAIILHSGRHSLFHTLTGAELLLDTFIDKHIGIHGSTQRQDHTGKTW